MSLRDSKPYAPSYPAPKKQPPLVDVLGKGLASTVKMVRSMVKKKPGK